MHTRISILDGEKFNATVTTQGTAGIRTELETDSGVGTLWMSAEQAEQLCAKLSAALQDHCRAREVCERHGFSYDPSVDQPGPVCESELLARKAKGEEISHEEFARRAGF